MRKIRDFFDVLFGCSTRQYIIDIDMRLTRMEVLFGEAISNVKSPKINTLEAALNKVNKELSEVHKAQLDLSSRLARLKVDADSKEALRIINSAHSYGTYCQNCGHEGFVVRNIKY